LLTTWYRAQLSELELDLELYFKNSSDAVEEIVTAITSQRDLFNTRLDKHQSLLQNAHTDVIRCIQDNSIATSSGIDRLCSEMVKETHMKGDLIREEALATRQDIRKTTQSAQENITLELQNVELKLSSTIELADRTNQEEHERTQAQIQELKDALGILTHQIKQ
jgi:polyhydroxyalkanoate synthesis regulator phasin